MAVLRGATHTPAPALALTALSLPRSIASFDKVRAVGGGYVTVAELSPRPESSSSVVWTQGTEDRGEHLVSPDDIPALAEDAGIASRIKRMDVLGAGAALVYEDDIEKAKGAAVITAPAMSAPTPLWEAGIEALKGAGGEEEDWEEVKRLALISFDLYVPRYTVAAVFFNTDKLEGIKIYESSGPGIPLSRPPKEGRAVQELTQALYYAGTSLARAYELVFGVHPKYLWLEADKVDFDAALKLCKERAAELSEALWASEEEPGRLLEDLPKVHREWASVLAEREESREEACKRFRAGLFGLTVG